MAHPLKKSENKREEPKLGEPKLVQPDDVVEISIAQELAGERVADTLIRARQQLGQDLRSIANVLCIRYSYLDAIERGQFENLPGPTYAVGFMRSYADYLGLDGDQIVERFKAEVDGLDSKTKLHFPTPAPEGKMPGGAVFLVAALLFAGAYGVWFYLSNQGTSLGDLVAPVPAELQEMVDDAPSAAPSSAAPAAPQAESPVAQPQATAPAPAETTPAAPPVDDAAPAPSDAAEPATQSGAQPATNSESVASPTPAAPAATIPPAAQAPASRAPAAEGQAADQAGRSGAVPRQPGVQPEPAAPSAGQQAAVPAAEPEGSAPEASPESSYAIPAAPENNGSATAFLLNHQPTIYGEENTDARIVLKASQDAWVQVRDREGNLLLTRVLRVGDSYRVPNQADLTLLTGNAGGLEISVDGSALPPLGPVGAVRRNIPLEPEALRGGAGRQP